MKIRGNTVGTTMKRPDYHQEDSAKSDYILNRPVPIATATDEGKILQVVGGKLHYVDMPTPEAPSAAYEIPTFDLVEMGLPAVPMDGTTTQFEMDTTEIMLALDKGAIKAIVNFLFGEETLPVAMVLNNISVSGAGTYICSFAFDIEGAPMIFNLYVTEGAVIAYFTILPMNALPEVTTDDNDKILCVKEGAWSAVTVAESPIKTYIDNYINEALGGDY